MSGIPVRIQNRNSGRAPKLSGYTYSQRYTYRVLQTSQMKLILLCVWAEWAVLGSAKNCFRIQILNLDRLQHIQFNEK